MNKIILFLICFSLNPAYSSSIETEPNDSKDSADPVSSDIDLFANQPSVEDIDWFYFTTTSRDVLTLSSSVFKAVDIYDSESNILYSGHVNKDPLQVGIEAAGTIYIKITRDTYINDYVLSISLESVSSNTLISTASNSAIEIVQKAYVAYYGRPGDPAGVDYWALRLDAAGGSWATDILTAFGNSEEFQSRFGSLSNSELVANIYMQLFNREPEQAGLDYFISLLSSGQSSLSQISVDILNGATGDDADIIANKLLVCDYFIQKVANGSMTYDSIESAKSILDGVASHLSSVSLAYAAIDVLATQ